MALRWGHLKVEGGLTLKLTAHTNDFAAVDFTLRSFFVVCGTDKYKPSAGDASCLNCPSNSTTNEEIGQTACVCSAGYQGSNITCSGTIYNTI